MVKFTDVKLTYTCPAAPPEGLFMDRIYTIGKDNKGYYFTDGNYIEYVQEKDLWYIKMLFSPKDCNWEDVDFSDEKEREIVKETIKTSDKTIPQK